MQPYNIGDLVEVTLEVGNGTNSSPTQYTVYVPPGTQHTVEDMINKVSRAKAKEMAHEYIVSAIQKGLEKLLK